MWQTLRRKFPYFIYQSYKWSIKNQEFVAEFQYLLGTYSFSHTIRFDSLVPTIADSDLQDINSLVFTLGIVEGISYWKLACSPQYEIQAGQLSSQQADWWKTVMLHGMGEYFFVNDIDFTEKSFLEVSGTRTSSGSQTQMNNPGGIDKEEALRAASEAATTATRAVLIPVGGGKDSIVSIELLKQHYGSQAGQQLGLLLINPTQAAKDVASLSGLSSIYTVHRQFDPQLKLLSSTGQFLNGHVPVSATFALVGVLVAKLFGYKLVAVSNERSSNEGNILFHNQEINHQWSKSIVFEQMLDRYLSGLGSYPHYISLLRPLYELQIAHIFSRFGSAYLSSFRSCNRGSKQNLWCCECSKCLFAYIIILPYLGPTVTTKIFGQDLLSNLSLEEIALELIGQGKNKPLDCVGMFAESAVAFELCAQQYESVGLPLPSLLSSIRNKLNKEQIKVDMSEFSSGWNSHHLLSPELELMVKKALNS